MGESPETEDRVRAVLADWQAAVKTQDIDRYMSLHWDDALKVNGEPQGALHILRGNEEIREEMSGVFEEHGEFLSEHEYPPAEFRYDEVTGTPEMVFGLENPHFKEVLRFEERNGEYKISEHWLFRRFFDDMETGELTAWADEEGNGNGILEPGEQERLFISTYRLLYEPGEVDDPMAEFFDWNGDGRIGDFESELAHLVLLRNRMRRIDLLFGEFGELRVPVHGKREVNIHDANWVDWAMLTWNEELPGSRVEENEDYEVLDFNEDGVVSPTEVEIYRDLVLRIGAVNPRPPLYDKQMPAFISDIRNWIDADMNGHLETGEITDAGYELFVATGVRGSDIDPAQSPIFRFFDRNRDSVLQENESYWCVDFLVSLLLPVAQENAVMVENWDRGREERFDFDIDGDPELSGEEVEEIRRFIESFHRRFWDENEADATEQRWLDENGDGLVERWEADLFRDMLFHAFLTAWLRLPEEEANRIAVRSALDEVADRNGDGFLSMEEREGLNTVLSETGEANTALAAELDFDGNGELTREEIYRAKETGYIPVGEGSAERRVVSLGTESSHRGAAGAQTTAERAGSAAAEPAKVKAVSTWGSSLAVLGVRDMSEKMAESQTDLLVSFIENAFVNYGNVTVVDRQNLEKIMEEYKYQTSALVDEETAVEIGKLSGADAIAIGNLSRLADTFYLHLKVINVQSGAIIGSSISEGASEKDFLGMCNGAVEPLF